ncbi:MAG: hypothetical protein R3D70_06145 [Rhizobiaceae bacterium]
MRYVIVIVTLAFFVIWDGLYNQGRYLDHFIRFLASMLRAIGL